MKKLLTVLLIATSVLTVSCGGEKVEGNKPVQTENKNELTQEHIEILDSSKTYEEMDGKESAKFREILEKWDVQTEEFKSKYEERKESISKSRDAALEKLVDKKNTKENIKTKAEAVVKGYEVSSLDILTLNAGGYSISVQIKSDGDNPIDLATELGNKIKEIVPVYDIQVIDSKYQITGMVNNDGVVELN